MVRIINIDTKTRTIRVSNEDKDIDWITVKGTHVPIKKGESKGEAVEKFFEDKGRKFYRGSVVHKDTIDGLKKAKDKHSETMKYWESEGKKNHKEKGYADFVKKEIEAQKQYAKRLDESIADISRDFEIDPEDIGMNKEFDDWKKSKQPAKQDKGIEEEYTEDDLLYEEARENIMSKYDDDDIAPNGYRATDFMSPQEYDARQKRIETEIEKEFKRLKTAKQQPAKQDKDIEEIGEWPKSPKFEKLTKQYMPKQGEADTELGEILRSINRIVYRYYNDGDMWNKGYGKETVNRAIKHLTELSKNKETPRHIARGLDNALFELKKHGVKDKDKYETALKMMLQTMEWADEKEIEALSKMKRNTEKQP